LFSFEHRKPVLSQNIAQHDAPAEQLQEHR
jgi:hypothetical protein